MQLVEFGHVAPRAGGVSGCLPGEGNAAVKGLLQGGRVADSGAEFCSHIPVPPRSWMQLNPGHSGDTHGTRWGTLTAQPQREPGSQSSRRRGRSLEP